MGTQNEQSFLQTPVQFVKGVGPNIAKILQNQFYISTIYDLLNHFPRRYVDKTTLCPISNLQINNDNATYGTITHIRVLGKYGKGRLVVTLSDKNFSLQLVWFKNYQWVKDKINIGDNICVFGRVVEYNNILQITHPDFDSYHRFLTKNKNLEPIYPSSEKLNALHFTNKKFTNAFLSIFQNIKQGHLPEFYPEHFLKQHSLIRLFEAFKKVHHPQNMKEAYQAQFRLKFDEFFFQQLQLMGLKEKRKKEFAGFIFSKIGKYFNTFYKEYLPFELTNDQKKVITEIQQDTKSGYQMNRLLQGDVGSGKTLVSLLACLLAIDNGFQACLMAPTEVLARQHFETFSQMLSPLNLKVQLLVGSLKDKDKKLIANLLKEGKINILVGTHALIQDYVHFKQLGLAIIDEQHRFGVEHRSVLWKKNTSPPHMLVMTATPIPRTLAMSIYSDLDTSIIKELPKGRKKIKTVQRDEHARIKIYEFIKQEIKKGGQAYIIYPLIEESLMLDYENVMKGYENIKAFFPEPNYHISMVHGKQSAKEKQTNMKRFASNDTQIMVATTVIEVGIDVPNANVMVIESAERFGLSQLHQLRGRIGRGQRESYCILISTHKLHQQSKERLQILCNTNDGFIISEKDLLMRGAGEIIGTKQSGAIPFKIANPLEDGKIMEAALKAAKAIIFEDPELVLPKHLTLKKYIEMNMPEKSFWAKIS